MATMASGKTSRKGPSSSKKCKREPEPGFVSMRCAFNFPSYWGIYTASLNGKFKRSNIPVVFEPGVAAFKDFTLNVSFEIRNMRTNRTTVTVHVTEGVRPSPKPRDTKLTILTGSLKINGTQMKLLPTGEDRLCLWLKYAIPDEQPVNVGLNMEIKILARMGGEDFTTLHKTAVDSKSNKPSYQTIGFPAFLFSDTLSDVTIQCGEEQFPAHSFILAGVSPVFMKMLTVDMKEKKEKIIEMKDVSPGTVKAMLRFMYTGAAEISRDCPVSFIQEIYTNADMYELVGLKAICETKIISMVNLDNVIDIYAWAVFHEMVNIKAVALEFLEENKAEVFKQHPLEDVMKVCPEIIRQLIGV